MVQLDASVELANSDADLRKIASGSSPEATLRRVQAIMRCRERLTLNVAPLLAVEEMTLSLVQGLPRPAAAPRPASVGSKRAAPQLDGVRDHSANVPEAGELPRSVWDILRFDLRPPGRVLHRVDLSRQAAVAPDRTALSWVSDLALIRDCRRRQRSVALWA